MWLVGLVDHLRAGFSGIGRCCVDGREQYEIKVIRRFFHWGCFSGFALVTSPEHLVFTHLLLWLRADGAGAGLGGDDARVGVDLIRRR